MMAHMAGTDQQAIYPFRTGLSIVMKVLQPFKLNLIVRLAILAHNNHPAMQQVVVYIPGLLMTLCRKDN